MTPSGTKPVSILFFSVLREILGSRNAEMTLDRPEPVGMVLDRLVAHHPELARYRTSMRVAVNMEYVSERFTVFNGDELAVITPVSGG